ncbi:MAG TPA: hypothetical protein VGP63_07440 [Planctomycetaceae bacterium]|jgi:hypothetical protein|nr:hypothetical protein [Planctomycetaceae bacterium]
MTTAHSPESVPQRSYFGIGGCCLFAIASACLSALFAANWHAEYKMAGFEGIIVEPFALLLYLSGAVMAVFGLQRRRENPFSLVALLLNLLPFVAVSLMIVFEFVRRAWLSAAG